MITFSNTISGENKDMNEQPLYEITTKMEKDDYRNFLFLTTFQTADSIVSLIIIGAILGTIASFITGFSLSSLFFSSFFFILVLFAVMYSKLEKNVKRVYPLDRPATIKTEQTLVFYDSYLTSTNRTNADVTKVLYKDIFKIKEDNSYIILMLTKELASLICKRDLENEVLEKISKLLNEKCKF